MKSTEKVVVAYVILHSSEFAYPVFFKKGGSLSDFNKKIIAQHEGFTAQIARAAMIAGFKPVVYYFSQYAKRPMILRHKYGYELKCIPVTFIKGKIGWEYSLAICQILKRDNPRLVHIHGYNFNNRIPDMYDFLAFFLKSQRIPFIAHFHGARLDKLNKARRLIKKCALQWADWIVCCNQAEVERLTKPDYPGYYSFISFDRKCVAKIENPLDLEEFKPLSRQECINRLNLAPDKRYLLIVSRLEEFKGIQDIISILPRLLDDIILIVVGDGGYKSELQTRTNKLGLRERVIFTGFVQHNELPYYFGASDVFVLPSCYEGLPTVIQEALSCRKIVVATEVGGIPELLSDGVGLMVPPSNTSALLEAIQYSLSGKFLPNWSIAEYRLQQCRINIVAEKLRKVYLNVLDNQSK